MRRLSLPVSILAIGWGLMASAATAQAAQETWVAGTGSDAGNCPITAPCSTFAYAHTQTNPGGSINVLSAGSFGPVTITQPISIIAEGVEAVINTGTGGGAGGAGAAITVNGPSGIVVSLRGLTIDLTGSNGINFVSGRALHVHKCVIRRTVEGIRFSPASGTSELYVSDSVIANTFSTGIAVFPTGSGGAKVALDRVHVENSSGGNGIAFYGNTTTGSIKATVRDSVSAGNGSAGIAAAESGSGKVDVTIDRTASVNNGTGILTSGAGATIRIGDSTVSGNATGLATSGGAIASYQTNKINGNSNDGVTPTTVAYK